MKSRDEKSQRREEKKRRRKKIKKRKSPKKEDPGARKGRTVAKRCVFPMICGSAGSKSRLAKAAGAEPCGQMRDEKLHAVVARSTPSKSKCAKHLSSTAILEVEMSKKWTPLWREAHLEVKTCKAHHVHNTFGSWDVQKVYAVVLRSTCRSQNVQGTTCSRHFWTLKRRFVWQAQRFSTLPKASKTWGFCIHPASRGVAAHTAGLFRSVRGAKGGFPPVGAPQAKNFHFPPRGGSPS